MKFEIRKEVSSEDLIKLAWLMSENERDFFKWLKDHLGKVLERGEHLDSICKN